MNRNDELRAWLRWLLASKRSRIIEQIHEVLTDFDPDWAQPAAEDESLGARLVNLRNAVAWQRSRPAAALRLVLLEHELDRLFERATEREQRFYLRLYHTIWVEAEGKWLKREQDLQLETDVQPLWAEVVRDLDLGNDEEAQWLAEARLSLALAVLDILITLVETRPLQIHLHETLQEQGGWQWL